MKNTAMKITYKKDGILIDENFISSSEITEKCNIEKVKEEKLLLLKMEWKGWRGFDKYLKTKLIIRQKEKQNEHWRD